MPSWKARAASFNGLRWWSPIFIPTGTVGTNEPGCLDPLRGADAALGVFLCRKYMPRNVALGVIILYTETDSWRDLHPNREHYIGG